VSDRVNILIVDDEEAMRGACRQVLAGEGFVLKETSSGTGALEVIRQESFDLVILDLKMPRVDGMQILRRIQQDCPDTGVVVITGYATVDSAVEAMKLGAADFLPKPFTPDVLRLAVRRTLRGARMAKENLLLKSQLEEYRGGGYELIGQSQAMKQIHDLVERVGPTDSTVLITGESGTGKELVARAIRDHSGRSDRPFVTVDCGALVGTLFESELFGHVKGSFTGATGLKHGRFELANGGTIFFDEIANVSPDIQAKLLRAGTCPPRSAKGVSGRTCSTGCALCRSSCPRSASGGKTSPCWPTTSFRSIPAAGTIRSAASAGRLWRR